MAIFSCMVCHRSEKSIARIEIPNWIMCRPCCCNICEVRESNHVISHVKLHDSFFQIGANPEGSFAAAGGFVAVDRSPNGLRQHHLTDTL